MTEQPLTLRLARPDDASIVMRLAQLDSSRPPSGPVLLAVVGSEPVAALGVDTGSVVADPFRRPPRRRRHASPARETAGGCLTVATISLTLATMPDAVAAVRAFNRFYTPRVGVLGPRYLGTPHTLAEARVLFELGQAERLEVGELRRRMAIDAGHLSRVLARLDRQGLVARERSPYDGRRRLARLTGAGAEAFAALDRRATEDAAGRLSPLGDAERRRLVGALGEVRRLLDAAEPAPEVVLRAPRPGDLGWIVQRHGELYSEEYGWDASFEALVARIVADYAGRHDPAREVAWIAEAGGERAGCVLCVRAGDAVAQLRLLLVEPRARGLGIGARLVDECIAFARRSGYRELTLWTNDVLVHARRIYERAGFALIAEEPHHSFGHDLVGQTWSRPL
jgi:DNA-binding MarR family transcriptional regulator/GNAT superfamily N-acetyltransferase